MNKSITYWHRIGWYPILMLLVTMGCTAGGSHFSRSYHVADKFETGRLLADHQYYHFGYPHSPDALVAIRKGYTLTSQKWQSIALDERELKAWVERMTNQPGAEYNVFPNGAEIFNDQGEVIGAWYSVWQLPVLTFINKTAFTISDPVAVFPSSNRGDAVDRKLD